MKVEQWNIRFDAMLGGVILGIAQFDPALSFLVIITTLLNSAGVRGVPLAIHAAVALGFGGCLGAAVVSGNFTPTSSTASIVVALGATGAYSLFFGRLAHDLTKKLRAARAELQLVDVRKTRFVQTISHEIRTPLTLLLQPLEQAASDLPERGDIATALRNARRLLRLVNQFLDFQRLESGENEVTMSPVNLSRVFAVCGDYFRSAATARQVSFFLTVNGSEVNESIGTDTAIWIQADVDSLEKLVLNFLSNALKYTPAGGQIELGLDRTSTSGGHVRMFVRDSGPGISKSDTERLFKAFTQLNSRDKGRLDLEGTGLGLVIARRIVESLGGKIGIDSTLGEGSTFWANLPTCATPSAVANSRAETLSGKQAFFADPEPSEKAGQNTPDDCQVAANMCGSIGIATAGESHCTTDATSPGGEMVLVIDDVADMRELVVGILRTDSYQIQLAADGLEGLNKALKTPPDIIVTDWMMPKIAGPDLVAKLREDARTSSIPIILLTAKTDQESRLHGVDIGADAYLGKPFSERELLATVRNLLNLKRHEKELALLNTYLTEHVLKRYLPPALVQDIVDGRVLMDDRPRLLPITVLFTDLIGFTRLAADLGPEGVAQILNEHLGEMTEVVFEAGGTIDKFIGDAVMVIFGAPAEESPESQVNRAVDCALEMQRRMRPRTTRWEKIGLPQLRMRIGIHHGLAVVGNFGSEQRLDYTAIGPTVNLASRIESRCPPGGIAVSSEVKAVLGLDLPKLGQFTLKGVPQEQTLYLADALLSDW